MDKEASLHPVILSVPVAARRLAARDLVAYLSHRARMALGLSADKSGLGSIEPRKDENGRPLPSGGNHWSLTHKPEYVAGVVARYPVGIDIEKIIRRKSEALYDKVAIEEEWDLMGGRSWEGFHRFWTAKEAVLKAEGTGLVGLSNCRVIGVPDALNLVIGMKNRRVLVEHYYFDSHIASIVKTEDKVQWTLID